MNLQETIKKILLEKLLSETDQNKWKEIDGKLIRVYKLPTYGDTIDFVNMVSDIAEKQQHHPEMIVGYDTVKVIIFDHEKGGISDKCYKFTNAVDKVIGSEELTEYSRTLKNARKQGVGLRFPKSAIKANPSRFRPYNK